MELLLPIRCEERMLKISIVEGQKRRYVVLEGGLVQPWAEELRTVCEQARTDLAIRELIIDLRNLTMISAEGEEVLLELMREGLRIRSHDVFTKQVRRQLTKKLEPRIQKQRK